MSTDPNIFFIVGAVRSGTTLLRLMMGRHPSICSCEEANFIAPVLTDPGRWPDPRSYHAYLRKNRNFRLSGYEIDEALDFQTLVNDFIRQRRVADGKPVFGAAIHSDYEKLVRLWPEARYIYITRDPRDVALSSVQMGWAGNAWDGAGYWIDAESSWNLLQSRVRSTHAATVRYEDLVSSPDETLTRLCSFLGLPFDSAMLRIDETSTYQPPNPSLGKSWRRTASPFDIRCVEARLGTLLAGSGYESSGLPPLRMSPLRRAAIAAQARVGRSRAARRKFGVRLWLAGLITRRLPFTALRERVQAEVDAIVNLHMK